MKVNLYQLPTVYWIWVKGMVLSYWILPTILFLHTLQYENKVETLLIQSDSRLRHCAIPPLSRKGKDSPGKILKGLNLQFRQKSSQQKQGRKPTKQTRAESDRHWISNKHKWIFSSKLLRSLMK